MKKLLGITTALAAGVMLAGCGSSDPNDDNHINGMSNSEAVIACQKYLANKTPGLSLGDFSTVSSKGIRKIRTGDNYHWTIQSSFDGRNYMCNVRPASADDYEVDGAFAGA